MKVTRDWERRTLSLSMSSYIVKLATEYKRLECPRRYVPFRPGVINYPPRDPKDPAPPELLKAYQKLIGKLNYPACLVRGDIAFHVSFLGRFNSAPTEKMMAAALSIVDYLYTTRDLALTFTAPENAPTIEMYLSKPLPLGLPVGYSDAAFADDVVQRKSTSGYLFKLCGAAICHKSSKQRLVTLSTTEAEYVALALAVQEATWLRQLLFELGVIKDENQPLHLYGDNEPSIHLVNAEGQHERTKHIEIRHHYIREEVKKGRITLSHIGTGEMAADGLTKPLATTQHQRFVQHLGLAYLS